MHFLLASWSQSWSLGSQANQQGFTWLKLNVQGWTYQLLFWWSSRLVRFRYQGFCLYIVIPFILPRLPDNSPISFYFFKLTVDTKILWYKRWCVLTRNCWFLYSSTVQVPELCSIQIPRKSISEAYQRSRLHRKNGKPQKAQQYIIAKKCTSPSRRQNQFLHLNTLQIRGRGLFPGVGFAEESWKLKRK
jgi:hypothetical protein